MCNIKNHFPSPSVSYKAHYMFHSTEFSILQTEYFTYGHTKRYCRPGWSQRHDRFQSVNGHQSKVF